MSLSFSAIQHSERRQKDVKILLYHVNTIRPPIQLTIEKGNKLSFLDVLIILTVQEFMSSVYQKPTCPWCNGYRHRKWTRRHEFKSWTLLIAFHIALTLGKGMNPVILPAAMGK